MKRQIDTINFSSVRVYVCACESVCVFDECVCAYLPVMLGGPPSINGPV